MDLSPQPGIWSQGCSKASMGCLTRHVLMVLSAPPYQGITKHPVLGTQLSGQCWAPSCKDGLPRYLHFYLHHQIQPDVPSLARSQFSVQNRSPGNDTLNDGRDHSSINLCTSTLINPGLSLSNSSLYHNLDIGGQLNICLWEKNGWPWWSYALNFFILEWDKLNWWLFTFS